LRKCTIEVRFVVDSLTNLPEESVVEVDVVNTALQAQHLTWSDQTLDVWLSGPRQFIPGAAMPVRSEAKALDQIRKRSAEVLN
jgi:predicted TIM-barrel fold metal-dependent hydrolase